MRRPPRKPYRPARTHCPHGSARIRDCRECRREYNSDYARRRRAERQREENQSRTTCGVRRGAGAVCGGVLETVIDRWTGRTTTTCPRCERRKKGICQDCPRPVAGQVGKSLRCEEHTLAAKRNDWRRYDQRHRESRRRQDRARTRRLTPEQRAHKAEVRRKWRQANPEKLRGQRRRYHLRQTPGYVEGYQRQNARPERQAAKREQSRKRYYELHPERPKPVCAGCELPIPYDGKGRPPKYHLECSPWKTQRKDYQHQVAQERVA